MTQSSSGLRRLECCIRSAFGRPAEENSLCRYYRPLFVNGPALFELSTVTDYMHAHRTCIQIVMERSYVKQTHHKDIRLETVSGFETQAHRHLDRTWTGLQTYNFLQDSKARKIRMSFTKVFTPPC
jgi:hypothetical protein